MSSGAVVVSNFRDRMPDNLASSLPASADDGHTQFWAGFKGGLNEGDDNWPGVMKAFAAILLASRRRSVSIAWSALNCAQVNFRPRAITDVTNPAHRNRRTSVTSSERVALLSRIVKAWALPWLLTKNHW
jgi:hypothetical protein